MKEKMKLNQRGVMSIISLIIVISIVIVASGFLTIFERTTAINEVQGIMDNAGIIALRHGVNPEKWRQEIIEIDPVIVQAKYKEILKSAIVPTESSTVNGYTVDLVKVHEPDSPGLRALGIPNGERGQYYLESLVTLKLNRNSRFGPSQSLAWGFYDFFYGSAGRYQGVVRQPENSNIDVLVIRSVTRLVLR